MPWDLGSLQAANAPCFGAPWGAGVAFSPDGLQIAAGTEVGTLGILSVADHKQSTVLHSHTGQVAGWQAGSVQHAAGHAARRMLGAEGAGGTGSQPAYPAPREPCAYKLLT